MATRRRPIRRVLVANRGEIAVRICERIATTPLAMINICEDPDMPSTSTLFRWLKDHPEFRELRERSKYGQLLAFASALPPRVVSSCAISTALC